MDELKILNWQGLLVDDNGLTFTLSEPTKLEYDDEYYDPEDCPALDMLTNEPATMTCDTVYINPDLWEMLLGTYHFQKYAVYWATFHRKDLVYRMTRTKKKRIRKKYLSRIISAYRNALEGL